MMKLKTGYVLLVLACVGLLLSGCGVTRLVKRWDDETYTGGPLKKVLVVGVFNHRVTRAYFENEFIKGMKNKDAVPSFTVMSDLQTLESKEKMVALVKELQVDSVLVVTMVDKREQSYHAPARVEWIPNVFDNSYSFYSHSYRTRYLPGFSQHEKGYTLETRVYALSSESLVWAGRTTISNPRSAAVGIRKLAVSVVSDMKKTGLLD